MLILSWFLSSLSALAQCQAPCDPVTEAPTPGYYKDLLIDAGIKLNAGFCCSIAQELGYRYDRIRAVEDGTGVQTALQNELLVGNSIDSNGMLLYPDGEPRFRMVWVMGGRAADHGLSLGNEGRARFKTFFDNGGSYSGSCAGAFIADNNLAGFFNLWTGQQFVSGHQLGLPAYHNAKVPAGSPLIGLQGSGLSAGQILGPITHNGGGYLNQKTMPPGTEILLQFDQFEQNQFPATYGQPLCWAYKPNSQSGRLVNVGSHPEIGDEPDTLTISKLMMAYALDGQGEIEVKATLGNGKPWCMNRSTEDADPNHTRIGDRQYHHFTVTIDQATPLQIDLEEEAGWNSEDFDLHLYIKKTGFAFENSADLLAFDDSDGLEKTLVTPVLTPGIYYIGVTCPNTVDYQDDIFHPYNSQSSTAVLNGVAYRIRATWNGQDPGPAILNLAESYCNNDSDITLDGWPTGGVFQGEGITGNTFSPSQLAPGPYELTYTVDCTSTSYTVTIDETPSHQPQNLRLGETRPFDIPLIVDSFPAGLGYHWEVEDSAAGSFIYEWDNRAVFRFSPKATSTRVRVIANNQCGDGPPSSWLSISSY